MKSPTKLGNDMTSEFIFAPITNLLGIVKIDKVLSSGDLISSHKDLNKSIIHLMNYLSIELIHIYFLYCFHCLRSFVLHYF